MKTKVLLYVSMIIILLSCAGSSRITHSWKAENATAKTFKKIMVVGMIKDNDIRLRQYMEDHLVQDLEAKGINAVSSLKELGPKSFLNMKEDEVVNQLRSNGVDAVLTIVMLDKQRERYYVPGRIYYSPYIIYHRRFWGYYSTIYDRIYTPGYYQVNTNYFWESNLYDLEGGGLIYSVQTESFDPGSTENMGHEYGKLIVNDLFKMGVLQPLH